MSKATTTLQATTGIEIVSLTLWISRLLGQII